MSIAAVSQPTAKDVSAPKVANPTYTPIPHPAKLFRSFKEFYPFYLGEHSDYYNRLLHLTGTCIAMIGMGHTALCAGTAALNMGAVWLSDRRLFRIMSIILPQSGARIVRSNLRYMHILFVGDAI
jgi:hypothetical protein